MAGAAPLFNPREILIHTPDGKTRALLLDRDRYTLGRSSANELCYSEDAGLSRQHMVLERNGESWTIRDLNSKNGTFIDGKRITEVSLADGQTFVLGDASIAFRQSRMSGSTVTLSAMKRRKISPS